MSTTSENSISTAVGRPFPKGVSGNPGGRPRGLASYVREKTCDGTEIVDLMVSVMRGETVDGAKPRLRDRMDAATWLSDRGFGRPVNQVESRSNSLSLEMTMSELTSEDLMTIIEAQAAPRT